jgi:hypothetical protein
MARNARQKARTRLPARTVWMALTVVLADSVRFLLPFDFS